MKIIALALALATLTTQSQVTGALNTAVNAMLDAAGSGNRQATKVVPIVTEGGGNAGFAQIVGSGSAVSRTNAVVEIARPAPGAGAISALIPVSAVDTAGGTFHRVYGVGIDALINYKS